MDDLIDVMILMMNSSANFTGPINIGNPGEYTMLELADQVLKLTGSKSKLVSNRYLTMTQKIDSLIYQL